jgi:dynein heavy chain, axonemal
VPFGAIRCDLARVHAWRQGLVAQLLNVAVGHERPELEEARGALALQMASDKRLLQDLEDTLLRCLSNARGNILDDHVRLVWAALHQAATPSRQSVVQLVGTRKHAVDALAPGVANRMLVRVGTVMLTRHALQLHVEGENRD